MSNSDSIFKPLLHPVSLIALIIVLSVIMLIGASLFGLDQGNFVFRMGERQFARGIITYLFAVTTIGTAVVLVVSALIGGAETAENFQRGKEVLSLLLGVFGTIVGFYFGSEMSAGEDFASLAITPIRLSTETVETAGSFDLTAFASGGSPPYQFSVTVADIGTVQNQPVPADGWITASITVPMAIGAGTEEVLLVVVDSAGNREDVREEIEIAAPAADQQN